jgi:hypothetical protein
MTRIPWSLTGTLTVIVAVCGLVHAQPSPGVQRRISAAIEAAGNTPVIDYTAFVNPFIGTGTFQFLPPTEWRRVD